MKSLYDDLAEKLARDPSLTRRVGPRVDLSLLLFNARESLAELWHAAEEISRASGEGARDDAALDRLRVAVESLRPVFGERTE